MSRQVFCKFVGLRLFCLGLFGLSGLLGLCAQLKAQPSLENQRKNLQKSIQATSKKLNKTQATKRSALNELQNLQNRIKNQRQSVDELRRDLDSLNRTIALRQVFTDSLGLQVSALRRQHRHLLVQQYQYRRSASFWPESHWPLWRRYGYMQSLERRRRGQLGELNQVHQAWQLGLDTLKQEQELKSAKLQGIAEQQDALKQSLDEKDRLLKQLSKEELALRQELQKKQRERKQLNNKIESVIRQQMAGNRAAARSYAGNKPAKSNEPPPPPLSAADKAKAEAFAAQKGKLPRPVAGKVVGLYGRHPHPEYPLVIVENNGIDIQTAANAQVKAVYEGEVVSVFSIPGQNNAVMLKHGGFYTTYSNLATVQVKAGQKLSKGSPLGTVAKESQSGKFLLHFELWRGKAKENPLPWLR